MNRPAILVVDHVWNFYREVILPAVPIVVSCVVIAALIYEGNKTVGAAAATLIGFFVPVS